MCPALCQHSLTANLIYWLRGRKPLCLYTKVWKSTDATLQKWPIWHHVRCPHLKRWTRFLVTRKHFCITLHTVPIITGTWLWLFRWWWLSVIRRACAWLFGWWWLPIVRGTWTWLFRYHIQVCTVWSALCICKFMRYLYVCTWMWPASVKETAASWWEFFPRLLICKS